MPPSRADTSLSPAAQQGQGCPMRRAQNTAPGLHHISKPQAPQTCIPPTCNEREWLAGIAVPPARHHATPSPPATCTPCPSLRSPNHDGAADRQRISPPAAARMTRGKVTKVTPSPSGPMLAAPLQRPVLLRSAPGRAAGLGRGMQRCQPWRNPRLQLEHCF